MTKSNTFSPEMRERAVRMVYEVREAHSSQWAAIEAVAGKIGCSAQTLSTPGYARQRLPPGPLQRQQMPGSKRWSARTANSNAPMKYSSWQVLFSPRRSSTAV